MSKKLFGYSLTESNSAEVPVSSLDENVVDISELLKKRVGDNHSQEPELEDDETVESEAEETEEKASPEKPEFNKAEFEEFKKKTTKVLGDYVKDPKKVTKVIIKFGGMLRMLLYPFIYRLLIYDTADERRAAERLLNRIAKDKRDGKETSLDPYDHELIQKWNDFKKQKDKIAFSDDEVTLLTEIFEDRVKDLPIAEWIEKYDWLLILLYVESKRFVPVIGIRMQNQMLKDFDLD